MTPRGDITSTGYALANPGEEYLILQPSETADPFTVELETGVYSAEWPSLTTREAKEAGKVAVEGDAGVRGAHGASAPSSLTPGLADTGSPAEAAVQATVRAPPRLGRDDECFQTVLAKSMDQGEIGLSRPLWPHFERPKSINKEVGYECF